MSSSVDCTSKPLPVASFEQGASAEKPLCSVKDAASRIRKSTSTVYRMRNKSGSIRFVVKGRRVYVEIESLEAFVDAAQKNCEESCEPRPEPADQVVQPVVPPARLERCEASHERGTERASQTALRSYCGERDLVILPRWGPQIVFFLA